MDVFFCMQLDAFFNNNNYVVFQDSPQLVIGASYQYILIQLLTVYCTYGTVVSMWHCRNRPSQGNPPGFQQEPGYRGLECSHLGIG